MEREGVIPPARMRGMCSIMHVKYIPRLRTCLLLIRVGNTLAEQLRQEYAFSASMGASVTALRPTLSPFKIYTLVSFASDGVYCLRGRSSKRLEKSKSCKVKDNESV